MKKCWFLLMALAISAAFAHTQSVAAASEYVSQPSGSELASRIEASPNLPFHGEHFAAVAPLGLRGRILVCVIPLK
jgi:hypothetical protein